MRPLERVRRVGHQTSNDVKRVVQTMTRFDNGFTVLGDIVWRRPEELTYVTDGLRSSAPTVAVLDSPCTSSLPTTRTGCAGSPAA